MKCPKGIVIYVGAKKFKPGDDVPKGYDHLFISSMSGSVVKKEADKEKVKDEPKGTSGK